MTAHEERKQVIVLSSESITAGALLTPTACFFSIFVVPANNRAYRLLPAVHRYQDLFQELAQAEHSGKESQQTQSISNYLLQLHPLDEDSLPHNLPARSRNIGTDCDSKKSQFGHDCCYLLTKAWDTEVIWHNGNFVMHPSELTEHFGVAALQISARPSLLPGSGQAWQCSRPLLLVENQALFDRCDWLPEDFNGCLVYYAGQLSDNLLQWFSQQRRSDKVILFPDYDGIGLSNYARLIESLHVDTTLQFY